MRVPFPLPFLLSETFFSESNTLFRRDFFPPIPISERFPSEASHCLRRSHWVFVTVRPRPPPCPAPPPLFPLFYALKTGRRFTRGAQAAAPGGGHVSFEFSVRSRAGPSRMGGFPTKKLKRVEGVVIPGVLSFDATTTITMKMIDTLKKNGHDAQATNISGMDVGPCRVVVCSADFAWYYNVRQGSNTSRQRRQQPRDATSGSASSGSSGGGGQNGGGGAAESIVESSSGAAGSSRTLRGFQLPSSGVTEARFSGDGERCFFGTVSGHIFVVSGIGPGLLVAC